MRTTENITSQNADVWSPLFSLLNSYCISRSVFDDLLHFIIPPPTITSFAIIVENFRPVLKYVAAIVRANSNPVYLELAGKIKDWELCCDKILLHRDEIMRSLPDMYKQGNKPYKPPFRGNYKSHPLGVALSCCVSEDELQERYRLLQGYLCVAFYLLRPQETSNALRYEDAKYRACYAVRKLALPSFADNLWLLPEKTLDFNAYRKAFLDLADDDEPHPLLTLFDFALEVKKGKGKGMQKRRGPIRSNTFNTQTQAVIFGDADSLESDEKLTVLTVTSGKAKDIAAQKQMLCSPDEFISSREYVVTSKSGPDPSRGLSNSQQFLMAKGAASAIAMHNQRFAYDWDQLSHHEIVIFIHAIEVLARQDSSVAGIPSRELAAFLAIVLWISADTQRAADATLVRAAASCKTSLGIQWIPEQTSWWIVSPRVPLLRQLSKSTIEKQALPLAARYTLAIPTEAVAVFKRHVGTIPATYEPSRIFNRPADDLERAADEFFRTLRRNEGGRQNLQRISVSLHNFLARMPGSDVTAAMAITGKNDQMGAVPLHYTANSIDRLQNIYSLACKKLVSTSKIIDAERLPNDIDTKSQKTPHHVGSRFVPREDKVTEMVLNLRDRLGTARKRIVNGGNPILLHNDLAVYTVMMIGFATGYRAVRDPLLQEAEIDHSTGFGIVSDKDTDDFYNARIVWLPEICLRQLDFYRQHVKRLQEWLFENNQELFFKSRHQSVSGRHGNRVYPGLFLMQKDSNDLSLNPKLLQDLLEKINYLLPMNANRHYLRSKLIASRCPVEVLDAFLGHWERGREPWGRYSGLPPHVYREELARHLLPLLKTNEWAPEAGLGATVGEQ